MAFRIRSSKEAAAERIERSWGSLTWLAGAEINGSEGLTLGRVVIRKGCSNPRHGHINCDEVLYLLAGKLRHTAADETVTMEPGDTLLIPAGTFHDATSIGDVDAEMIVAYSSGRRDFQPEGDVESE